MEAEAEVEAASVAREVSEILSEAGASVEDALGVLAEADCSGSPLLVWVAQVVAPLLVHPEWQYSGW